MAHPDMKVLTNEERPGHQKSLSSRALVQKCPACPVVGESCIDWTMACRSCGGIYMCPLKYRWPVTEFVPLHDIPYIFLSPDRAPYLSIDDFLGSPDRFLDLSTFVPSPLSP